MAKKFVVETNEKKRLNDALNGLASLRLGVVALRRFASLQPTSDAAVSSILGAEEAAELAAIAAKVRALLADLDRDYPEALGL